MNYKKMLIKIINSIDEQSGFFEPYLFLRVKTTNSKIISSVNWNYVQNKNILQLICKSDLEIYCTRCLMLVKKRFDFNKTYKIFNTTYEANCYSNNLLDDEEIISVEENPTILTLIEDELLFEFLQIIDHVGCNLPHNGYLKDDTLQKFNQKKIKNNNPFAKLREKFSK